ncbi:Acg family FMN-binding oxidoreductase [Mycobacterium sp. Marseille-P9652]|uniref:Acg family FMN-binding oxidoreductase n=1 Tax=Mycobacterium sp. Marseille-P9652 TaxID=2654950 RepID=UPI0012E7CDB9|nr:NAD(P)H nitroreductase [Mycobacterium sp. Marseille-P9652]
MDAKAPTDEVIRDAVTLACRAPSLHNSQPWRWISDGTRLHLWADPRHSMPGTDHTGRELLLSCGAVLDHLRVAMAAAGWDSVTERFPSEGRPDHLATLGFLPVEAVTAACRRKADAIRRRRTDRLPMGPSAAWPTLHSDLCRAVIPYDVSLDVVADEDRPALAEASRLTEQLRRNDTSYLTELRWWTSPFEANGDHVPESALLSSSEAARVDIARAFPPAGGGRRRAAIEADRSKIVVLSTRHDDAPAEVLRCGEALSAVLLECTVAGMATCTLTHMTELSPSRDIIRQVTGGSGRPQLLIRVGRSPAGDEHVDFTARRPVNEVLEVLR